MESSTQGQSWALPGQEESTPVTGGTVEFMEEKDDGISSYCSPVNSGARLSGGKSPCSPVSEDAHHLVTTGDFG